MAGLQQLVDDAVAAALEKFAPLGLHANELAVTLLDLGDSPVLSLASPKGGEGRSEEAGQSQIKILSPQPSSRLGGERGSDPKCAHCRGDAPVYPASVVKLFYLVAAHRQMADGKISDTPELRRALHDMIVHSGNEATGYVLDMLTGTTSGPELPSAELADWLDRRNAVNRYFLLLGYTGINANRKTWNDGPYGRDWQAIQPPGGARNFLTTNAAARLLAEIATGGCISVERCAEMLQLLKRDLTDPARADHQAFDFIGGVLPAGAKLWSKAGYMSVARHDAALVEMPDGGRFVLVIFTERHSDAKDIIPAIARQIVAGFEK